MEDAWHVTVLKALKVCVGMRCVSKCGVVKRVLRHRTSLRELGPNRGRLPKLAAGKLVGSQSRCVPPEPSARAIHLQLM